MWHCYNNYYTLLFCSITINRKQKHKRIHKHLTSWLRRWISSKNKVGRSWTGFVKSCVLVFDKYDQISENKRTEKRKRETIRTCTRLGVYTYVCVCVNGACIPLTVSFTLSHTHTHTCNKYPLSSKRCSHDIPLSRMRFENEPMILFNLINCLKYVYCYISYCSVTVHLFLQLFR